MNRIRLLMGIAACALLMAGAVFFGSVYTPSFSPYMEIEEVWAIEDERGESEQPLVTALENDGVPLAYDRENNTFYCTLGLEQGEEWPALSLTAPGAPANLRLAFVDDYTFDSCCEAISDGVSYQAMAWNDTEYAYFNVVFTGLPLVMLSAQEEITAEETRALVTVSEYEAKSVCANAMAHVRGASSEHVSKKNYKVEFVRGANLKKKGYEELPVVGMTQSFILNSCSADASMLRDRVSWAMYAAVAPEGTPFGARRTGYAEVFINEAYAGCYLLMEPMDVKKELSLAEAGEDSVYKNKVAIFAGERPAVEDETRGLTVFEQYAGETGNFVPLEAYLALQAEEDEDAFIASARECIDVESMLRYDLLVQLCGMTDNVFNNLYVWAHHTGKGVLYRFAPWDMDMSWGNKREEIGEDFENWLCFPICDRMLRCCPDVRERMAALWTMLREDAWTEERIMETARQLREELTRSGAWLRETERWGKEPSIIEDAQIETFAAIRLPMLDSAIEEIIECEGETDFLLQSNYEDKGIPMDF